MHARRIQEFEASLESVTPTSGNEGATFEFLAGDDDVYLMTVPIRQLKSLLADAKLRSHLEDLG